MIYTWKFSLHYHQLSRKYVPPATSSDVHLVWNHIRATTVILKVVFKFCYQLVFFLKKTDAY